MNRENIQIIVKEIEAMLYLASELEVKELAKFYSINVEKMIEYLERLEEKKKNCGINLKIEKGMVYFETNPKYGEAVHNFFNQESKPKKLSRAAMETLSIIAYKQPVTKNHIESIRGVSVERVIHNLEEKDLVYSSGKLETIGRPNLYSTTDNFLNYLNIDDLTKLPNYTEIREELGTVEVVITKS
ncbi:SMC-Scp complex subunit ScpB [Psychrilyobacter sp.]|uniref:SMC-Scp complex subunit ScpB n=1 Tax=Psychrilyobacter sp. TaxID=2586924 RepID=UPI003017353D